MSTWWWECSQNCSTNKRSESQKKKNSLVLSFFFFYPNIWRLDLRARQGVPESNIRHKKDLARVAFQGSEQEKTLHRVSGH